MNLIKENPKNICKNNLIGYLKEDIKTIINKNIYLFTFDKLLEERQKEINLIKIKNFLKVILKKEMFKKIFGILYTKEKVENILNDTFIDDYIDSHLFLICLKIIIIVVSLIGFLATLSFILMKIFYLIILKN